MASNSKEVCASIEHPVYPYPAGARAPVPTRPLPADAALRSPPGPGDNAASFAAVQRPRAGAPARGAPNHVS